MNSFRRYFSLSNIGTFVFFALNLMLLIAVFTEGFVYVEAIPVIIVIYAMTIGISLSPIGEMLLSMMVGAKEMSRNDMKIKMIPLLEIVFGRAKAKTPEMVGTLNLKIVKGKGVNAMALGRQTICVTEELLDLPDDMIMGILAHEVGHIANRHTEIQLVIGGANILITGFLLVMKIIAWIITGIFGIAAIGSRKFLTGCLIGLIGSISVLIVYGWIRFCNCFLRWSMRQNEFEADKYAYDIGFGNELAKSLDTYFKEDNNIGFFKALYSTHPSTNERVARLQDLGVDYSRYFGGVYNYS